MTFPGYKPVIVFGVQMKIDGQQVFFNVSRNEYSVERDHSYLVHPTENQQRTIDAIFAMAVAEMAEDDDTFAKECELDKTASLHQTDLW